MRIYLRLIYIIIFIHLAHAGTGYCYWVWTPETRKWINPKYAPKDTPKEQLLYAMDFFEAKDYKKALSEFGKIIRHYRRSEAASEAQYYMGLCYENMDYPYQAFESFQKVIDDYPFTQRTEDIVNRQFDIGNRLYEGEKTKFFGLKFKALPEQIIDVYKKVVSNAPYSPNAPVAQFRVGELYKKISFYQEAREAFQKIVDDYPDSDVAQEAKFQLALTASVASSGSSYDQSLAEQALDEFEEFKRSHPDSELVKTAEKEKREIIEKQAAHYMENARFYERLGRYNSAAVYYKKILDEFSSSSFAPKALERFEAAQKRVKSKAAGK
ncbi:MAG: outer membrane protein assembly factor BamD [Candidatus Omnitrophica bacterium]|jgi:outer membrane protein assembly factor BamD|nr:outer membrane protein assembly factor BamD [Candidatus Omnitrophota bacterium]